MGPQAETHSTWLKATYGGGKTQALQLLTEALGENHFGEHKVLVCKVDLNRESSTSAQGFELALFESASVLSSPNATSALADFATYIRGNDPSLSKSAENAVSIGVDIFSTAINFKAPGAGILAKGAFGALKRKWSLQRRYLKKAISKRGLTDAQATELMIRWSQFSLSPTDKSWRALDNYVQRLVEKGQLFLALTHILKASGYATVVIQVDQAEKLVGNRALTDELMNIHAPGGGAGLNLFFVFAGTTDVEQLNAPDQHGGFARRFLDPKQASLVDADLDGPDLGEGPGNDIDRIRDALAGLRQRYPGLPIPTIDAQRVKAIRCQLGAEAKERTVTWPMLWRLMLIEGAVLDRGHN